jgi:hypothetical protein
MGIRSRFGATRDAALPDSGHPVVLEQRFRFLEPVQEQKSEGFSHVQGLFWQYSTIKIQNSFAFPIVQFYFHVQLLQSNNNIFCKELCLFLKCLLTTKYCVTLNHIINHFMESFCYCSKYRQMI